MHTYIYIYINHTLIPCAWENSNHHHRHRGIQVPNLQPMATPMAVDACPEVNCKTQKMRGNMR